MGPLKGMRVVEIGSIGPGPFCAQMLADMGADIIRIDRKVPAETPLNSMFNTMLRSRRSVTVDLKNSQGVETVLRLIEKADALVEGFRPGVTERLGIGPVVSLKRNPKLIYGRMTGWGQTGPLSETAGHDINYIALSGALHAIGHKGQEPVPPLNLVGDFGGGGMMLAFGIMCALFETQQSGKGQVVDASMVEGSAAMLSMFYGMMAAGGWSDQRGTNLLDGGAHFYSTYETSDNKWIAIGAIEPQFYKLLLEKAEIIDPAFEDQMDNSKWPELKAMLAAIFKTKTRDEWCDLLEGSDACFSPVLSFTEAAKHPHNIARQSFVEIDGIKQPAPAPKFSRTKPEIQGPPPTPGQHNESALVDWGFDKDEVQKLIKEGVL